MWFSKMPTVKAMPPICTNCLHAEEGRAPKCFNPLMPSGKTSPVDGAFEFPFCAVARMDWPKTSCGPEGRFFQPKRPAKPEEPKS